MQRKKECDAEWIAAVARAACLELDEGQLAELARSVEAELQELCQINGVEVGDWMQMGQDVSAFREDLAGACLDAEKLLSAATCRRGDCFAVPEMLRDGGASS